jgi:hypothetical protein
MKNGQPGSDASGLVARNALLSTNGVVPGWSVGQPKTRTGLNEGFFSTLQRENDAQPDLKRRTAHATWAAQRPRGRIFNICAVWPVIRVPALCFCRAVLRPPLNAGSASGKPMHSVLQPYTTYCALKPLQILIWKSHTSVGKGPISRLGAGKCPAKNYLFETLFSAGLKPR